MLPVLARSVVTQYPCPLRLLLITPWKFVKQPARRKKKLFLQTRKFKLQNWNHLRVVVPGVTSGNRLFRCCTKSCKSFIKIGRERSDDVLCVFHCNSQPIQRQRETGKNRQLSLKLYLPRQRPLQRGMSLYLCTLLLLEGPLLRLKITKIKFERSFRKFYERTWQSTRSLVVLFTGIWFLQLEEAKVLD